MLLACTALEFLCLFLYLLKMQEVYIARVEHCVFSLKLRGSCFSTKYTSSGANSYVKGFIETHPGLQNMLNDGDCILTVLFSFLIYPLEKKICTWSTCGLNAKFPFCRRYIKYCRRCRDTVGVVTNVKAPGRQLIVMTFMEFSIKYI